jgi:hypothetical protein
VRSVATSLTLLFLSMCILGGAGGALGSMAGHGLGPAGLFVGGIAGGLLFVVAAGFLSERQHWIGRPQRLWAILGGGFGFVLACIVALATLASPIGPILSTLLIGAGAVFGALVGRSAHNPGLTSGGGGR